MNDDERDVWERPVADADCMTALFGMTWDIANCDFAVWYDCGMRAETDDVFINWERAGERCGFFDDEYPDGPDSDGAGNPPQ